MASAVWAGAMRRIGAWPTEIYAGRSGATGALVRQPSWLPCLVGSRSLRSLFYCLVMGASSGEWVRVVAYENLPKAPRPAAALAAWLRDQGIDWMPFADDDIRIDLACGKKADGSPEGWHSIKVRSHELRRLGLHPD